MRTFIQVDNALRKELQTKFKKTRRSVYSALNFITSGESAESIRQYALAHGGKYLEENFTPNCSASHQGDTMIQTFPCGVVVITNTLDSTSRIEKNGKEVEKFSHVTLKAWGGILKLAQDMSDQAVKTLRA